MSQGNIERRLQRAVEDCVARRVGEITQYDRVFFSESVDVALVEKCAASRQCQQGADCRGSHDPVPGSLPKFWERGGYSAV